MEENLPKPWPVLISLLNKGVQAMSEMIRPEAEGILSSLIHESLVNLLTTESLMVQQAMYTNLFVICSQLRGYNTKEVSEFAEARKELVVLIPAVAQLKDEVSASSEKRPEKRRYLERKKLFRELTGINLSPYFYQVGGDGMIYVIL